MANDKIICKCYKVTEKDIKKATDDAVKKIDSMTAEKEKELLNV